MAKFIINGETPLKGEITTAGNKNAALPIIVATLLTEEKCLLKNIPEKIFQLKHLTTQLFDYT